METRESYQTININLKKILTSLKKENYSLLDIYTDNNYLLSDFIASQKSKTQESKSQKSHYLRSQLLPDTKIFDF